MQAQSERRVSQTHDDLCPRLIPLYRAAALGLAPGNGLTNQVKDGDYGVIDKLFGLY
jgi:hypothetical protein